MSDVGATAAQRYRQELRSKAARMGGGGDARSVDASDFTPGERLDTEAKTGMRPVSRQARRDGGTVSGAHAAATPGRAARKSGGGFGESFANRDMKEANEDRAGVKHDMGLKKGGRARRQDGGGLFSSGGDDSGGRIAGDPAPQAPNKIKATPIDPGSGFRANGGSVYKPDIESGVPALRNLKRSSASGTVETRVGRAAGGPLSTPLAAGMGGQGRFDFNFPGNRSQAVGLKDGGRAKAHERYGHGPSCTCSSCRSHKADGGKVPQSDPVRMVHPAIARYNESRDREAEAKLRTPAGEADRQARNAATVAKMKAEGRAKGGKVAEGALRQHRDEHQAMGIKAKARASGGRSGKGKTNINIIIGSGARHEQPGAMPPPPGMNPQLAIRPPMPPMPPSGMPPPGAGPPMGAPMGATPPPGMPPPGMMPPRARGGRAPKMEAGAGSGLGRLEKIKDYGKRSREGED